VPTPVANYTPIPGLFTARFQLRGGGEMRISVREDVMSVLQARQPGVADLALVFDRAAPTENEVEAGSLGGGGVTPVTPPVSLRFELRDGAGERLAPFPNVAPGVDVRLDMPVLAQPGELPGAFAWLRGLYEGGAFLGYLRPDAQFDAETGMLVATVPLQAVLEAAPGRGMLLLPTMIQPSYVANHSADLRIYSGPTAGAQDFGPAGPAFTTFTVLAPQVAQRLFVLNPVTGNYGWIDVAGIGPVAAPAAAEPASEPGAAVEPAAAVPGLGEAIPISG
jgi:hypothetical protein